MFSLPAVLQDIFFDGTFYHLWYFPSCILGSLIAYYLVKKYDYRISFIITFILYLIGLGGDTYYGIFTAIPALKHIYAFLFTCFDYTRNGLFFAPIFFVLGGYIHDHTEKNQPRNSLILFIVFTIGMLLECYLSHQVNIIPVNNNYHLEYAKEVENLLKNRGIRVNLDDREEKVGYKIVTELEELLEKMCSMK